MSQIQQSNLPNDNLILGLGIGSIIGAFCCGFIGIGLGIGTLLTAKKAQEYYALNPTVPTSSLDMGRVKIGKILGIVGLSISIISIVITFLYYIYAFGTAINDGGF